MSWRVHVPEGSIRRLDILSGKPSLLAVWLTASHVLFYDLQTGQKHSEARIDPADARERTTPTWKTFLDATHAPNHIHLPYVRAKNGGVYSSSDGAKRVIALGARDLLFVANGAESRMPLDDTADGDTVPDAPIVAIGADRAGGGTCAVLDALGRLTLFKDANRVGTWPVPLSIDGEVRPMLVVGRGSMTAIVSDGKRLIALDGSGKVRAETELHFTAGAMAGSSDGKKLVLTDLDGNILRVYTGALVATHQRFAVDLLAEARRAQVEAIPESGRAALGAIAINSKGVVAFAVASTLCVTSLTRLSVIPRPTA